MFSKLQIAAVAALAAYAVAYTPADYDGDDYEVVTVTVTNTKTWCPCETTGLSSWASWASPTPADPTGWEAWASATTSYKPTSTPWSYTTTSTSSSTTSQQTYYGNGTTTTTTSSTSTSTTSSTTSSTPTPTFHPGCKLVDWIPGTCQDDSYFKLGDEYLYQSCNRKLIETDNYLEDYIEAFCDATSVFDGSFRATAWEPSTSRCYVYTDADDIKPSSFPDSTILAAGNVDYTVKFDSDPCAGFNTTGFHF